MSIIWIERVMWHSKARGTNREVLKTIAFHAHDDGTHSFPSIDTLASEIGRHRGTVIRCLANVGNSGELLCEKKGKGRNARNEYTLRIPHAGDIPGKVARCDHSCHPKRSHPAGEKVASCSEKGRTVRPEPSGTVKEPSDAPACARGPRAGAAPETDNGPATDRTGGCVKPTELFEEALRRTAAARRKAAG